MRTHDWSLLLFALACPFLVACSMAGHGAPDPTSASSGGSARDLEEQRDPGDGAAEGAAAPMAIPTTIEPAGEYTPGLDFETLSATQVAGVAAMLAKLTDREQADTLLEKLGLSWAAGIRLRWHIAAHGLLAPVHPTVLPALAIRARWVPAELVFRVVPRLAEPDADRSLLLPTWSSDKDAIVLRAMELDPDRLAGLLADAPPTLRLGIQFVRARGGAAIPSEDAASILRGLAAIEATGEGLNRQSDEEGGERLGVEGLGPTGRGLLYRTIEHLAALFGTREAWLDALAEAAKAGKFSSLRRVVPGLARLPLAELMPLVAPPSAEVGPWDDADLLQLITLRNDDPIAFLQAVLAIGRDDFPRARFREPLLVHAIARMGAANLPLPAGIERELRWDNFPYLMAHSRVLAPVYDRAVRAFARERILTLVDSFLAAPNGQPEALLLLASYFDGARFQRLLDAPDGFALSHSGLIGPLGANALPYLLAAHRQRGSAARKSLIAGAIRTVLAYIGAERQTFAASLDSWVSAAPGAPEWSSVDQAELLFALRAMPEARRMAVLDRLFAETPQPERAFFGVQTVEDPAYRKKAARALAMGYANVADDGILRDGLTGLGATGLASFREALIEVRPDSGLFDLLSEVFGRHAVDELRLAADVPEEADLPRLLRLTKAYLAANPRAPSVRIYLLEFEGGADGAPAPRQGSFSRSRGEGPGGVRPAGNDGNARGVLGGRDTGRAPSANQEHVLTLDLDEVPELKARYPRARALALYAESPYEGQGWERAKLVAVPPDASVPPDGTPITVIPLVVPKRVFDDSAIRQERPLRRLRWLLINRPGYVLGGPLYIQEDEGRGARFVMQLHETIGDLGLGDTGSLYVFDRRTFMQCY